jgi:phage protein D
MSFAGVQLSMMIGKLVPTTAPAALMLALRSAEITVSDSGSSGFQLQFQMVRSRGAIDYDLLPYLAPWNRVVLSVGIAGSQSVICDGLITNRTLTPGRNGQPDTIDVTGEDVSVAMDLTERSMPYPSMDDYEIVNMILLEYFAYGIVPTVYPTEYSISDMPEDVTNQQMATDRAYIRSLATRNGYVFFVRPGPVACTNIGYFGPPIRVGYPYPALSITPLPVSAVESVSFTYDALAPEVVYGDVQDTLETDMDVPILALGVTRTPPLAAEPALIANLPYFRTSILCADGMDPIQAYAKAQGQANLASDKVLVAQGEIDVFRYQTLLGIPGIVGVRGAGYEHDGYYYVTSLTHSITPTSYKQKFSLAREGLGSIVPEVYT